MPFFRYESYPKVKDPVEIRIAEFLTQDEASGIYLGNPFLHPVTKEFLFWTRDLCAINTGIPRAKVKVQPTRGIHTGKQKGYLIEIEQKKLVPFEDRYLLGEADKMTQRVVFEGTIDNLLEEFRKEGFSIVG